MCKRSKQVGYKRSWKDVVDEIWVVTITNDGATILKQIEVTHLATKFTENQVPVLIGIEIPETTEISILK
jgi:hypothetical protein